MIILTMVCDRCSKKVEEDVSDSTSKIEDWSRKLGFQNIHANKKNMLICNGCANQLTELKDMQATKAYNEICEFFKTCGKDENGDSGETENG